jgi:integrase/recombinase XerD
MSTPSQALILSNSHALLVPTIIADAGNAAPRRFIEFFTAEIPNDNTRVAYFKAISRFLAWCDGHGFTLHKIEPVHVAAYIKQHPGSDPTKKQHLAAIRALFDYLVVGQILAYNPAASVRGPRYSVKKGKTPVLAAEDARRLLDSIDSATLSGLRDRALIAAMAYSFARISAVVKMNVADYYANGKRHWLRLHEKGGKEHDVPAHHNTVEYLDAYIDAADIRDEKKMPLFRAFDKKGGQLTDKAMSRFAAFQMIRRRAEAIGLTCGVGCHTFRATGITTYLQNGGRLEHAQAIANHESARTTKLYDRTQDDITLDEINRIVI